MIGAKNDVVTYVINNKNFDYTNLIKDSYIEIAEYKHIKPILGAEFYDLVNTTPSSYATLVNTYLKKLIAYYTVYEAMPFLNLQITDKGIMVNNSEQASQASSEQRSELRSSLLSLAETLRNEMIEYMKDDETNYESGDSETTRILGGIIL